MNLNSCIRVQKKLFFEFKFEFGKMIKFFEFEFAAQANIFASFCTDDGISFYLNISTMITNILVIIFLLKLSFQTHLNAPNFEPFVYKHIKIIITIKQKSIHKSKEIFFYYLYDLTYTNSQNRQTA